MCTDYGSHVACLAIIGMVVTGIVAIRFLSTLGKEKK